MTLVPGTASGVLLKLKFPKRQAWVDSLGWRLEERRWFRVMSHWGRRQSHSLSGTSGSQAGTETGYKIVLEGLDGTFCCIATVAVRRDTLEINFVFHEGCFEVR